MFNLFSKKQPNYKKALEKLEGVLRNGEVSLSGYLYDRRKYRLTDKVDIQKHGLKSFKGLIKNNEDLNLFIQFHFYLGRWVEKRAIIDVIDMIKKNHRVYPKGYKKLWRKKKK